MSQNIGVVLRIASGELVDRVFDMAIYYTNLNRKWDSGQIVLFLSKSELGDAFVGYGAIERGSNKKELSDHERVECERGGWKCAIEFRYVKRFDEPLLIRETFLKDSKLRGRFFHGLRLTKEQVECILRQTAERGFHQKS